MNEDKDSFIMALEASSSLESSVSLARPVLRAPKLYIISVDEYALVGLSLRTDSNNPNTGPPQIRVSFASKAQR